MPPIADGLEMMPRTPDAIRDLGIALNAGSYEVARIYRTCSVWLGRGTIGRDSEDAWKSADQLCPGTGNRTYGSQDPQGVGVIQHEVAALDRLMVGDTVAEPVEPLYAEGALTKLAERETAPM